jgi:hypothetical protein
LGLSSPPAKPANVEKADPAAAAAETQKDSTSHASPGTASARRGTTDSARLRKPSHGRNTATSITAPPESGAATPGTVDTPDPLTARAAVTSPTGAPLVAGSRPAFVDERSAIYSKTDVDVVPAKLLTVQNGGPTFRNMKMDVNTMELVISKQGRVEQVHLMTPVKRMTDMLLLSGAKTWRFSPALRNGQPVRYRTQYSWQTTP